MVRQRPQLVQKSLRGCHPSATSGIFHPRMAAENSPPSQDAERHGANSTSSYTFPPPAHLPSPSEEKYTTHVSRAPCSMSGNPEPWHRLTSITCKAMIGLLIHWVCGITVKDQARTTSWRKCSLTNWRTGYTLVDSDGLTMPNAVMARGWPKKIQKLNPVLSVVLIRNPPFWWGSLEWYT